MKIIISVFLLFISPVFLYSGTFIPAAECGKCHRDIYREWQSSRHANASPQKDPLYAGMYDWAVQAAGDKMKNHCISCHAPFSAVFQNQEWNQPFNQEGITCQFCHGAAKIAGFHNAADIQFEPDTVYSYQPAAENPAHTTAHRDYYGTSSICLPCHAVMKNPKGVMVCATGEEWQAYAERTGAACQDCHMPKENGRMSHLFGGTHNGALLDGAVDLKVDYTAETGELRISLTNSQAGHALPTGTPMRMVYLKVRASDKSGNLLWENWKENPIREDHSALFMKILGDSAEMTPRPPWEATGFLFKRLLMPDETVDVHYKIPEKDITQIETALYYRFAPAAMIKRFNISDRKFTAPKLIAQELLQVSP
ncbi:MAG: multiheme c-type cytochrome [Calditrichia bacterium]